jgi:hypothetical protein
MRALSMRYAVSKNTICEHRKRAGLESNRDRVPSVDLDTARKLYEGGQSL